jgi:hypothetical protein
VQEENENKKNYSAVDIRLYAKGKLTPAEMHAMEKAALEDPFLADAIEGTESSMKRGGVRSFHSDMTELQKRLSGRVGGKSKTGMTSSYRTWWQVAAAVIVVAGAGLVTYQLLPKTGRLHKRMAVAGGLKRDSNDKTQKKDSFLIQSGPLTGSKEDAALSRPATGQNARTNNRRKDVANPGSQKKEFRDVNSNPVAITDTTAVAPSVPRTEDDQIAAKQRKESIQDSTAQHDMTILKQVPMSDNASALSTVAYRSNFAGKVVDMNNKPVSGATIAVLNERLATVTNNRGLFRLRLKNRNPVINVTVHSAGFEPTQATLTNGTDITDNIINLRSKSAALTEVMVNGYQGSQKNALKDFASDSTLKNAVPVIGWAKYRDYINKNKRLPSDSSGLRIIEVISFTIRDNGKLSHFNAEQSYDDDYDAEAIRLIKKGPAWKLLRGKKTTATLTISF